MVQYKYTYDDLSQLIREDNRPLGYSYTYTYDNAGNILNKKRYSFTTGTLGTANLTYNYSYDDATWGDLLTSFGGNYIAYDEIGNPVKIGNYDEAMDIWWYGTELTWDGRELVSYRSFDYYDEDYTAYGTPITFTYNADGIRTSKTVNGVEHLYYLNGSQITAETWTSGGIEYMLMYVYDETGSPIAIKYRTSSYAQNTFDVFFFEKNLQGDIVAIYNSSGTKIGSYTYDAWGNFTVTINSSVSLERLIVSTYNPFRYRGYYYDTDTSLYYLQSRYYNAQWGRFINADTKLSGIGGTLLGYNVFTYCMNNPISMLDHTGEWPSWKDVGDWFAEVGEAIVNEVSHIYDSIVVDIGFGAGLGFSVEMDGVEGAAMIRYDFVTMRKDAGSDVYFGQADEIYYSIEAFYSSISRGNEKFYDFDGNTLKDEEIYPHYETVAELGASAYIFCLGFTFSIGFDFDYYIFGRQ